MKEQSGYARWHTEVLAGNEVLNQDNVVEVWFNQSDIVKSRSRADMRDGTQRSWQGLRSQKKLSFLLRSGVVILEFEG